MKILHTADLHLREYGDDRWRALEKLVEAGRKENINVLAVSGDLFDGGIDAEVLKPEIRNMFSGCGFKVVVIPGNHDVNSYREGVYFGEDVVLLGEEPFECGNVSIWGMPFELGGRKKILTWIHRLSKRLSTGKINILLFHGELLDAFFSRDEFGNEGDDRYMPVKLSYFRDLNIQYVLGGHFHSHFRVWEIAKGKYFVYPGSPVSVTAKETGRRKADIFEPGMPPGEYLLDTRHFEEIVIRIDPFGEADPLRIIRERIDNLHPDARAILRIEGFINSSFSGMDEAELKSRIDEVVCGKSVESPYFYGVRDVRVILEDSLFRSFSEKLDESGCNEEEKERLQNVFLKAMLVKV